MHAPLPRKKRIFTRLRGVLPLFPGPSPAIFMAYFLLIAERHTVLSFFVRQQNCSGSSPGEFHFRKEPDALPASGFLPARRTAQGIHHEDYRLPFPSQITSRIFRTFFWGLARLNSPLTEIRPSWEAFAHPRSGCLLWFLVTKRILSTHETSSHEDSAPTDHFRRAGARASKCPAGAELLKGRLVQRPHIKIAFSPPFMARDVP